ncbi:hypothetical protein D9M71_403600 [compost metagenome]
MGQLNVLQVAEALGLEEVDLARMVDARLAENPLGAWVIEEHVMHQRAEPAAQFADALVLGLADHHMPATVVIGDVVVGGDAVFLAPVHLEVGEGFVVEAADQRVYARVVEHFANVLRMFFRSAGLLPEERDLLQVHPAVEGCKVLHRVDGAQ